MHCDVLPRSISKIITILESVDAISLRLSKSTFFKDAIKVTTCDIAFILVEGKCVSKHVNSYAIAKLTKDI